MIPEKFVMLGSESTSKGYINFFLSNKMFYSR